MEEFGKINLTVEQLDNLQTPCYMVNEVRLEENLQKLDYVQKQTSAKIILALKGFAMWSMAGLVRKYLPGTTASSLHEAMLGHEEFGGEVHIYSPAYREHEFDSILKISDHLSFNSVAQWKKYKDKVLRKGAKAAIRINPQHSEVTTPLYDPSAPFSRLGMPLDIFRENIEELEGITGLHIHNLCQHNSDALERTLEVVERNFGFYFDKLSWINLGGGHHITRGNYDIALLIKVLNDFQKKYPNIQIYLEPGEAVGLNTGVLVTEVLDIFKNEKNIAILDASAAAHMPDVIEMPYRPPLMNSGNPDEYEFTYRFGGNTCLAGDVIGEYSFKEPLKIGDKLIFGDMAIYTMVKNTTFNGIQLPSIYSYNSNTNQFRMVKKFGYPDFKGRLS